MTFNSDTNLIKQFISRRKSRTFLIVLLGLISNVLTILIPVSVGRYYQLVFDFKGYRLRLFGIIPSRMWDTVPKFLVIFFLLVLIRYVFFFFYQYYLKNEGELFIKRVKDYLFGHQLLILNSIYKEKGIGKYLLRYSGDISSLKNLYLKGSISAFVDVIMIVFALIWLYGLNHKGTIAIVVMSAIFYVVVRLLNKKVEKFSLLKRNQTSSQLSFVSRTLNTILSISLFNKQKTEVKKYRKKSRAIMEVAYDYNKWLVINKGFVSFIQYAILCLILYLFYLDINSSKVTAHGGTLISFILLFITIRPVVRRLFALETVYKLGNISLNKLKNIVQLENENLNEGEKLVVNNPRVTFEDVRFNKSENIDFNSKKMALSELLLPVGVESIDIISAMGRILHNYKGKIKINGKDIRSYSIKSVRNNIAFISKEIPLVGRTVYEAITQYRSNDVKGKAESIFLEIQAAFKMGSNLNLDDQIGENGSQLSIVQYELLCFVRGILYNKKIIVLDYLPSLESANPSLIMDIINRQKATVIKIKY